MARKVGKDKPGVELNSIKESVSVYCRLKPLKLKHELPCIKIISPSVLSLSDPSESKVVRKDVHYTFHHIFTPDTTQQEVFINIAYPLLKDLVNGGKGLLFTYGVTGSGKTYTLDGECFNPGITPRCINTIFESIKNKQLPKYVIKPDKMNGFEVQHVSDAKSDTLMEIKFNKRVKSKCADSKLMHSTDTNTLIDINDASLYAVFISYIEIYNNTVHDLLDDSGSKVLQSKILRNDSQNNMYVNGVVEVEVKSPAEAFELYSAGKKRKRVGHTLLNVESSRSHSIFTIRIVQLENAVIDDANIYPTGQLKIGQLCLVDLAGSERCNRAQTTGMRLKEASAINNSLMTLRNCLEILRDNQLNNTNKLIPYRESRLTHIFKSYFEGGGKIEMMVCVNPMVQDFEENMQVLKFAELTQDVKVIKQESRYTPYRKVYRNKHFAETPISKIEGYQSLQARIPLVKFNIENIEETIGSIHNLTEILISRKRNSQMHNAELNDKTKQFRGRLNAMNHDNSSKAKELKIIEQRLRKTRRQCQQLVLKIKDLKTYYKRPELIDLPLQQTNAEFNSNPRLTSKEIKIKSNFKFNEKRHLNHSEIEKLNMEKEVNFADENEVEDIVTAKLAFEALFVESANKIFRKTLRRSKSLDYIV